MKILKIGLIIFLTGIFFLSSSKNKQQTNYSFNLPEKVVLKSDFKKYFEACNAAGCIVIFDNIKNQLLISDSVLAETAKLPASTFKIINLLIALETGVIGNENEIIKWPGQIDTIKYGYRPDIYHDMSVKEAFEVSAGWVFVELAKKIGIDNYRRYLKECNYGNQNLSEPGDDFWNFGEFAISPVNQVTFIRNLYEGNLPFSERNMEIVKRVMITEQTKNYLIRAKTGWTRENGLNTGWWVGFVETKQGVWYFATLLLQDRKTNSTNFGSCRKEITKAIFKDLEVIKD
jgi:beta-lactamase class D